VLKVVFKTAVFALGLMSLVNARAENGGPSVELAMKGDVVVTSHDARLDELASVNGGDQALCARLSALQIRIDSLPGQIERITRDDIQALIALRLPELSGHVVWSGADSASRVHLRGRPVDVKEFTSRAQAALEEWLRSRFSEFAAEPVKSGYDTSVEQTVDETVSIRPFKGPVSSRSAVWVDIGREGQPAQRSFPIWFSVVAHSQVPVAAHDIPAGSRLASGQIANVDANVANIGNRPLVGETDIDTAIAIAPVRQGEILTRDRFRNATPVEAGDEVRLQVRAGTLVVEAHGIALESGANGQRVHVRNAGSGEVLVAAVTGHDIVEVSP